MPTAKQAPGIPAMVKAGANTASIHNKIKSLGKRSLYRHPIWLRLGLAHVKMLVDVLDGHGTFVYQNANSKRKTT